MSGVSLKDLKDSINRIKSTRLEDRLGETLIGGYTKMIDNYYKSKLSSGNIQDFIPTLQFFLNSCPEYKNELLELYDNMMLGTKGVENVPNSVKIAQAALFDSLCFVADFGTESGEPVFTLATMNFSLLYDLKVDFDMQSQVIKKNKDGIVKAYRVDIEYDNSEEEFTFKAVNARNYDIDEAKSDTDDTKRFFVIPYIFVLRFMKLLEGLLNKGYTLRVHQSINSFEKVRFVTNNKKVLASMCDDADAVSDVSSRFFPLKAFFYAPLVGAPSTSAMVTNINIFNVDAIAPAKQEDFEKYGVHKPTNVVEGMIGEGLVLNRLELMKESNPEEYANFVKSILGTADVNTVAVAKYLHTCGNEEAQKIYDTLGVSDELSRRIKVSNFGTPRRLSESEINNIGSILKERVCRILIQKKDCTLSSVLCTNNPEILKGIYGEDYVSHYEGLSTRFYLAWAEFENSNSVENLISQLKNFGITVSADTIDYIKSNSNDLNKNSVKARVFDDMGVSLGRSEAQSNRVKSDSVIFARGINAYIDAEGKTHEYMKNIDTHKVIKAYVI